MIPRLFFQKISGRDIIYLKRTFSKRINSFRLISAIYEVGTIIRPIQTNKLSRQAS